MTQFQPGQLDSVFDEIDNTQTIKTKSYAPRIPEGVHELVLNKYTGSNSQQGNGVILEAEFIVAKSTTATPGGTYQWPWFPNRTGLAGGYEKARMADFFTALDSPLGLFNRTIKQVGGDLASGARRGQLVRCEVKKSIDRKTGQIRRNNKGQELFDATFSAIAQTMEDIQKIGAGLPPLPPVLAPAPVQQPQYAQQAPQYAAQPAPQAPQYAQAPQQAPQYAQAPQPQYAPQVQAPVQQAQYMPPAPAPTAAPANPLPSILQGLLRQ